MGIQKKKKLVTFVLLMAKHLAVPFKDPNCNRFVDLVAFSHITCSWSSLHFSGSKTNTHYEFIIFIIVVVSFQQKCFKVK